jgi:hypothetical protein
MDSNRIEIMEKGFYKLDNGSLLFGTIVTSQEYLLIIEEKENYELPIDGWYYFETNQEARDFFGILTEI